MSRRDRGRVPGADSGADSAGSPGVAAPGRGRSAATAGRALPIVIVVLLSVAVVESWFPFRAQLPVWWRTTPVTTRDGAVRFDGRSVLASPGPMRWVADARDRSQLDLHVELRAARPHQVGPARVLTISESPYAADLMLGQDAEDLVIRVRRPGSDGSGEPPFVVPRLLSDGQWHGVDLVIGPGASGTTLAVRADGRSAVDAGLADGTPGDGTASGGTSSSGTRADGVAGDGEQRLAGEALAGWNSGYRVALGDEPGGERGWRGDLRAARIEVGGQRIDLLAPGVLTADTGAVVRSRARHLLDPTSGDPAWIVLSRLAGFVPVGVAFRLWLEGRARRRLPAIAAVLAVTGLAAILTLGKLFVAGRHPSLGDALVISAGGLLGVWLGGRWSHHAKAGPPPSVSVSVPTAIGRRGRPGGRVGQVPVSPGDGRR